jgi:hypothetical protein
MVGGKKTYRKTSAYQPFFIKKNAFVNEQFSFCYVKGIKDMK